MSGAKTLAFPPGESLLRLLDLRRHLPYFVRLAAFALAFIATAKVSRLLALPGAPMGFDSVMWLPSGLSIGLIYVRGLRYWPGVFLGCLAHAYLFNADGAEVFSAVADTVEAVVGTSLARRFATQPNPLRRTRELFKFFFFACVLGPMAGATTGWWWGRLSGTWVASRYEWLTWALENAGGAFILAPLVVAWTYERPALPRGRRLVEGLGLVVCLVLVAGFVFEGGFSTPLKDLPLEFLCTPFLVWASLRFGPLGAATAVSILTVVCLHGTSVGTGPFLRPSAIESLHLIQSYLATNTLLALLVAAVCTERQLANDQLRRSNVELERFAYLASHDLQEPLRTVIGFCTLIERKVDRLANPEINEYSTFVIKAARRMHALINLLLDYSRVGKRVSFEAFEVERSIDNVLSNLRTTIAESGAEIHVTRPLPTIVADPSLLELLFQNLICNAIKFRSAEAPRILISAGLGSESFHFIVADNGIGIGKEYHERVFRLFERLAPDKYEGTGMGLAVCKKIVDEHGGKIWIEPAAATGCEFHFTLAKNLTDGTPGFNPS